MFSTRSSASPTSPKSSCTIRFKQIFFRTFPCASRPAPSPARQLDHQYRFHRRLQRTQTLIDYSATKGAVVSFTRSLALSLIDFGIRVNAVAPGPIWTPLIVSSFSAEEVATFGTDTPIRRAGQPYELAPAYVYLASGDSSYVTGETVHVNGGDMVTT
ncbi:hypothetical protein HMSSN036_93160 [Paenibacillus macerans]|nr:hypothetical protein HMSSN036_93160 [Paenibacillus macerans]